MSVLGIDQITYGADDLATCRTFFQDWGLTLKSEAADELVFECLNGCRVVVAALDKPGLPPAITALDGPGSEGLGLRQKYSVRILVRSNGVTRVFSDESVAANGAPLVAVPSNVGVRTMPDYPALAAKGIFGIAGNAIRVFAGQRKETFAIDLASAFDTLNFRRNPPVLTNAEDASNSTNPFGVNDFEGGRVLGEQAVKLLNGKGKVAIITSVGATNLESRLAGMKDALAKAPGIQIVEVFDIKEDTVRCAELIATGTARYPDLAAWLSTGGWPVFTRNATAAIDPATPARSLPSSTAETSSG